MESDEQTDGAMVLDIYQRGALVRQQKYRQLSSSDRILLLALIAAAAIATAANLGLLAAFA